MILSLLQNAKKYLPIGALLFVFSLFYLQYISLVTADLGRHIINGRELLSTHDISVLYTNTYSYTNENFKFINHHWFFGVLVYVIHKYAGFSALTLFNLILYVCAFFLALKVALKKNTLWLVTLVGFLVMPLITHRTEIRPESISLFLFSLYFFLFDTFSFEKIKHYSSPLKILIVLGLCLIQILWVNTHLFFILGPCIAGLFALKSLLSPQSEIKKHGWTLMAVAILLLFASLVNPFIIQGVLQPLQIFTNYGYRVAENQSTAFLLRLNHQTNYYLYVIGLTVISIVSFFFSTTKKNLISQLPIIGLTCIFVVLTHKINRVSPFLGIVLIPILATNINSLIGWIPKRSIDFLRSDTAAMVTTPLILLLIVLGIRDSFLVPPVANIGTGLSPQMDASARFFIENKLQGPIFNNYDIGGYLIYYFYPQEKVFVDNRPEAYPNSFLQNEYIAAQTDTEKWNQLQAEYDFQVIYFYRLDMTEWAQPFLIERLSDPNWVPVFVDVTTILFVKNSTQNQEIIQKFAIPKEYFSIS